MMTASKHNRHSFIVRFIGTDVKAVLLRTPNVVEIDNEPFCLYIDKIDASRLGFLSRTICFSRESR